MLKKNITYALITSAAKILSSLLLIVALSRLIDLNDFGVFAYGLTFATIWGLFIDYGFSLKLVTDLPRNFENQPTIMGNAIATKLCVVVVAFLFAVVFFYFSDLGAYEITVTVAMCVATTLSSFGTTLLNPYKVKNRYQVETFFVTLDGMLVLIICSFVAYKFNNVYYIAMAYMLEKLFSFILMFVKYKLDFKIKFPKVNLIKRELMDSWPYATHFILGGIYLNIDTIILKFFVSNTKIAIYQAGMRLIIGSGIILALASSVMLPNLAGLFHYNKEKFYYHAKIFNWIFILLGLTGSVFLCLAAKPIILLVYGAKFYQLNSIICIFAAIIFLRYAGGMYGVFVTVSGNQAVRAIGTLFTLIYVVISDIIVIPRYGIMGAAINLLVAHIFLDGIYIIFTKMELKSFFLFNKCKQVVVK